jgi:acyl-CoA synthetase (AMP-forming)/AMP-acid ligase II
MSAPLLFPQLLHERALRQGEAEACRFFKGPSLQPEVLSFADLYREAAAFAAVLREAGLADQRALLVCKSQRHFVVAFYACLLAGVTAVPTAPPRRQVLAERLQLIARDAQALALILDADELAQADLALGTQPLRKLDVRAFAVPADFAPPPPPEFAPQRAAFLQYTSGSTGDPKGVVVSHANLVRNCAAIEEAMALSPESWLFTALPLFHDMGLVGGVLQLCYTGCVAGFLAPAEFVQYPERWLQILSRYRVTVSGGPNFMYELAARAVSEAELQGVDLSAWRVAFCGAEPIRAATVTHFAERFRACGFRAEAFYPCYGMAESTLLITGARVGTAPRVVAQAEGEVVGCGVPRADTRIAIVDPHTRREVEPGERGEIWVAGGSVAQGYWMRPDLSEQVFGARLADAAETRWLRTGDLGFLRDGELFVAGRLKDLVIVNGRKYAPQDLEVACEAAHAALRQDGGAAFGVAGEAGEQVVVVFELRREWLRRAEAWAEIAAAAQAAVGAAFGLAVAEVVLIRPGTLPRTSSGKVRRAQCRADYLAGALERVATPATASA